MIFTTAQSIVTALNAANFDEDFTAALDVLPRFDRSEFENLIVRVLPVSEEYANQSRKSYSVDFQIDIGVQIRVSKDKNIDVMRYSNLTKSILEFMFNRNFGNARFTGIERDPIYDIDLLTENVFASVITASYRSWGEQVTPAEEEE